MGTLVPPAPDPFKDHLVALLSLHDAPPSTPLPRYAGPPDWQTDAILRAIERLMKRSRVPTQLPPANGAIPRRPPPPHTPTLTGLPAPDLDLDPLLHTCPACGHRPRHYDFTESPGVVPAGGALASAASQGGMDALEELRLLKDQVRDVSRVCNAVATGDLTQKITVPVQGDLMVQLKKVRCLR
ncbi:hypothetical protein B0H10DRAFT_1771599 [Mycena sp. CBHHK59/15]|nr:hypothetical protein B0H10DRAFT_1771599 [Mycena sp. CBHHK59/15]